MVDGQSGSLSTALARVGRKREDVDFVRPAIGGGSAAASLVGLALRILSNPPESTSGEDEWMKEVVVEGATPCDVLL